MDVTFISQQPAKEQDARWQFTAKQREHQCDERNGDNELSWQ
jgi:hypothetical protein